MKTKTISTNTRETTRLHQLFILAIFVQSSHDHPSGCTILFIKMGRTIRDACAHSGGDEDSDMNLIKADGSGEIDWFMNYTSQDYLMSGELFVDSVPAKGARYVEKD